MAVGVRANHADRGCAGRAAAATSRQPIRRVSRRGPGSGGSNVDPLERSAAPCLAEARVPKLFVHHLDERTPERNILSGIGVTSAGSPEFDLPDDSGIMQD